MAIDWDAYRKKAKQKDKEDYLKITGGKKKNKSTQNKINAPVKKTLAPNIRTQKTTFSAPTATNKKEKDDDRTWFQKSEGNVGQAILGSIVDIGENIGSGVLGMGERAVDALAMLGTTLGNAQMSQLSNDELAFSALKNIGKDKKTKNEEAESIVKKYDTWQKESKKGTTEFVKKDLYDEEKIAKKIITASVEKYTGVDVEASSVFGEKTDALIQSGGQLLATAGLNAMGVPWFLTTGAISFGAEAENALNQGATFEQASMSAAISAGAEILTEKLSGGIKFGGKTLDDRLIKPFVEKISNKVTKSLVNLGIDALGEGSEEVISSIFSNLGSALYKEESIGELLTSEEAVDEYIESFIGGAVLGGVSSGIGAVANRNKVELTEDEQKVFDKVVEDRIAEEKADGTITKKKENEIRKAVLNDMLKGYIDTDTVESVLDSENYKTYKDTVDNETALQKEFDTLNKMKQGEMTGEQLDRRTELKQQLEELKDNSNSSQLKNQLSSKVFNLVKDSRLAESYNEKTRRGQAFQADFSKYDTKQQETIKKAIESGILNNTNRTHEFVDMIAKISADTGVLFDFTNSQKLKESGFAVEGKTINGLVTAEGNVAINVNSAKALNSVVGHEITHVLEGTELYKALQESIIEYSKAKGEYDTRLKEITQLYEGIEGANIENELTADLVGDYLFTDSDFISRLSMENRNVFQKIYDEIKYLCKIAAADSKEARELEKVKKTFEEIYRESVATVPGETKYSMAGINSNYLSDSIEKKNEILYNKSSPLAINNRAKTNNSSSLKWAYDAEIFSVEESKLFHEKISEINQGSQAFEKNALGEYMLPIENKIVFTDGNYDSPYVREIIEVLTEYQTEFEDIRESIYNVEKGKSSKQDAARYVQNTYGKGRIVSYTSGNNGVYGWENGKRKGKSRSTVVRNYLNKQHRRRNDRASQETPINEITPIKEASSTDGVFSLSSENTPPQKHGDYNVSGEEVMLQPSDDIAPVNPEVETETTEGEKATDNAAEAPIATVKQKISVKLKQSQTELSNNQKLQEKSNAEFDNKIAEAQDKYNAMKNKNTKAANDLLRRIETLKRRKSNINADYTKKINDIESRISRLEVQLLSNHNKADRLERFKKREAKRLDADKKLLTEEFEQRKAKLQEEIKDKNSFIGNKALELYKELNGLKKGVRASEELGYFLDHGFNWSELKSTLLKVSKWPDVVINSDSEVESVVREAIGRDYEGRQYELHNIDNALDERIEQLEADAQKKLEDFKVANRRMSKQNELESQMEALIGDTSTWVDKKLGLQYKVNTLRRNLRDIVRDAEGKRDIAKADAIYDELQGKYNHNEAELNREATLIKQQFTEMKITNAEDIYIQMLGELRHNPDTKLSFETVEEFYEEHQKSIDKDKVDKVIKMARPVYDDLLLRVNKVLSEHGMKEIPYRKGYFPHFTEEKQGFLAKLLNWRTQKNDIPTDIAGLTENFNPNRSWQSFNKHRVGDDTIYSFTKGLDQYVQGSLDWIYHIEDIQKRRAFEHHIRYVHSEQGIKDKIDAIRNSEEYDAETAQEQIDLVYKEAGNPLNNFVSDFRTATNTLAGKKSSMDRGTEELVNRKIYSTMTNISNRVSANMVAGSVSSALTNFIPITQSWVEVSLVNSLRAMGETIASTIRDDGTINKSDFLTNRLNKSENLYKTNWDKIGKGVSILMDVIDNFTAQTVWRSKYIQNMSRGMSESQAIKNADQFASNVMADRSRGNQPTIFDSKSPVSKIFTAFQLEVNNQYGYFFKDAPLDIANKSKARLIHGYATAFIGAYVYNALYSYLTGRDAAFDPIGIIEELMKDLGFGGDDEEEEEIAPVDVALNLTNNVLEEVPFIGGLLGGGRIPISSAMPYGGITEAFEGTLQDWSEGNYKKLTKEWLNPVYYLALPMGGGQIRKTNQGLGMFSDKHPVAGSYTDSGNLRFPVDDTLKNRVQAGVFGQWANDNARTYFDEGYAPLKEKQLQEYIDVEMPIREYWQYREDLKGLDSLEEKFDFIAGMDLPVEKKNILINNIVDRKEKVDLENYDDFENYEEFDFYAKNTEKYKFLQDNGVSYKEYKSSEDAKENYDAVYSWWKNNPEKVTLSKAVTDNVIKYRSYASELDNIRADKDSSGNSIVGSAKEKKKAYIWGLDIDECAKYILFKNEYKADDTYNYDIIDYLNSRDDISYDEMNTILTELGFKVDDEGYITWD